MRVEEVSHDPDTPVSLEADLPTADDFTRSTRSSIKDEALESTRTYTVIVTAFQKLIDALSKDSKHSKLSHPLTVALISSFASAIFTAVLVGLIGGGITYYYTSKTQAIARRQSQLDGINNARVPKLGELWEQLDADDLTINQLLEESNRKDVRNSDRDAKLHQVVEILKKDRLLVGRNRFWLGDEWFKQSDEYLDRTIQICLSTIGDSNPDLTQLRDRKDALRQDVIKIRDAFLEGNSNY
jgi:hypothetical protein